MVDSDAVTARLHEAQSRLADGDIADGLILFPSSNLYYLTRFHEEPAERHLLFIVTPDAYAMLAPTMYESQIIEQSVLDTVETWSDDEDPVDRLRSILSRLGLTDGEVTILVDDQLFATFLLDLQAVAPGATFGLASDIIGDMRIRKDEHELGALREAARISDAACLAIRDRGEEIIGMTEREVVAELRTDLEARGGAGFSFDPVVAAGPNGAMPHYRHGDRTIEAGNPVVLDFGTMVDWYPGDQTRTVVFAGDPPAEFETVHETVLDAFEAAVDAVEPGVAAEAVDRAARSVIESAGYGDAFLHRTGHGVGLEVHELPYIVDGNETTLEPGMVHSIEPGIYLEGRFGVRIEDLVVVTEDGCKQLNDSPRTWGPR